MSNEALRRFAAGNGVKLWQVAEALESQIPAFRERCGRSYRQTKKKESSESFESFRRRWFDGDA